MTETQTPQIIQTVFPLPVEAKPESSLVATWIRRKVEESDLLELEPNLSKNLVRAIPRWKEDVVAQPTRLVAALLTNDIELLEGDWSAVERALTSQNIPIDYVNRFAFDAAIVIEEFLSKKSFAHLVLGTAAAFVVSATGAGEGLIPHHGALGDAAIHLISDSGFLFILSCGPSYIAKLWPGIVRFSRGEKVPPPHRQPLGPAAAPASVSRRILRPKPPPDEGLPEEEEEEDRHTRPSTTHRRLLRPKPPDEGLPEEEQQP
jgi:hypothetical protein